MLPYHFPPAGFMFCEGKLLGIATHVSLFSLLRTTSGGDGVINLALPDLRGMEPADGLRYCIAMEEPARPSVQ